MAKEFYRSGVDIFDATTNQRITSPDWEANWTGRATEVTAPPAGVEVFNEGHDRNPESQAELDVVNDFDNGIRFPQTSIDTQTATAQQRASSFNPSVMLQALKQGLKIKQKPEDVKGGLPTGLMQRAGFQTTGKGAFPILSQALNFQRDRLVKSTAEITKFLEVGRDIFRDQATLLKDEADRLTRQQEILAQRQFDLDDDITKFEQQKELLKLQEEAEIRMARLKSSLSGSTAKGTTFLTRSKLNQLNAVGINDSDAIFISQALSVQSKEQVIQQLATKIQMDARQSIPDAVKRATNLVNKYSTEINALTIAEQMAQLFTGTAPAVSDTTFEEI